MSFIVNKVAGSLRIDPDAAGQGNQRKRDKQAAAQKRESGDSVSISEEARRLYSEGYQGEAEGAEG